MATITTCDGTGVEIPADTPPTGYLGHQYSEAARPIAEQYLAAVDTLHTETARDFEEKLAHLRTMYREKLRELPDQP